MNWLPFRAASYLASAVVLVVGHVGMLAASMAADSANGDRNRGDRNRNVVADWRQFRGPSGQGTASETELPLRWSDVDGVRWKTALPGRGWSSPVVADGRIWVTTAIETAATAEQQADMLKQVEHLPISSQMVAIGGIDLLALEIDLASGQLLRQVKLFHVDTPTPIHGLNSYASPTPALGDGRLYCHFGRFGTACVDLASGAVRWRRQLEIDHIVGPGSSPVLFGDRLLVTCDGGDEQYIAALDVDTGEMIWRQDRPLIREENPDLRKAFSTPLVIEVGGRPQAVIPGAQWFIAYDPATGEEIWRVDHGNGFSNVPCPVFDGERLFLCTGFTKPQLWAVRPDGSGDVSDSHVAWRQKQQVPAMSSPAISQGRVYMVSDGGVASCLVAATGDVLWRERMPGKYSASPLVGAGRVYFCSQEGRTTVIADAPEFQELARNDLDGMLMASPAVAEGDMLLRSDSHLYRIGERRQ